MHPQLQTRAAEADTRAVGAIAEELAAGRVPSLAEDFAWRGKPCRAADLAGKLRALEGMSIAVLETRVVPADATAQLGPVIESFSGVPSQAGERLAIVTLTFGEHVMSWGLVVTAAGTLRAWFDPSALLQLIAP